MNLRRAFKVRKKRSTFGLFRSEATNPSKAIHLSKSEDGVAQRQEELSSYFGPNGAGGIYLRQHGYGVYFVQPYDTIITEDLRSKQEQDQKNATIQEQEAKLAEMGRRWDEAQAVLESLDQDVEGLRISWSTTALTIRDLKEEVKLKEGLIAQASLAQNEANASLDTFTRLCSSQELKIQEQREAIENMASTTAQIETLLQEKTEALAETLAILEGTRDRLATTRNDLSKQSIKASQAARALNENNIKTRQIEFLQQQYVVLQGARKGSDDAKRKAEEELRKSSRKLQLQETELADNSKRIADLTLHLTRKHVELEETRRNKNDILNALTSTRRVNAQMKRTMVDMESTIGKKTTLLNSQNQEIARNSASLNDARLKLSELQNELNINIQETRQLAQDIKMEGQRFPSVQQECASLREDLLS